MVRHRSTVRPFRRFPPFPSRSFAGTAGRETRVSVRCTIHKIHIYIYIDVNIYMYIERDLTASARIGKAKMYNRAAHGPYRIRIPSRVLHVCFDIPVMHMRIPRCRSEHAVRSTVAKSSMIYFSMLLIICLYIYVCL